MKQLINILKWIAFLILVHDIIFFWIFKGAFLI